MDYAPAGGGAGYDVAWLVARVREAGVEVSYFGVWNFVHNAGLSYKKKPVRQ